MPDATHQQPRTDGAASAKTNRTMLRSAAAATLLLSGRGARAECLGAVSTFAGECTLEKFRENLLSADDCPDSLLFGEGDDAEDPAEAVAALCEYDAPVQFVEIQGSYQDDKLYFAGGGRLVDGPEPWEVRSAQIKRFAKNVAESSLISWPEYYARLDYNADNGLGDNGYPANMNLETSCALRTAMCCFADDSEGDADGFSAVDATGVCRHDLSDSPQSNHIRKGWSVFPGSHAPVHCTGFTWEEGDESLVGNMLWDASLGRTAEKGWLRSVPGAPLCGCVEHMPTVERAACRTAKLAEGTDVEYTFTFDGADLSASSSATVEYGDCPEGDLAARYKAVRGDERILAHLVGAADDGGVGCADDAEEYLNDEQFLHVGRHPVKYADPGPGWSSLVVGEGTRFLPPVVDAIDADAAFRALIEADCGGRKCIVRRVCDSCRESHRDIFYVRRTDLPPPGTRDADGDPVYDASAGQVYFLNTFMNDWFDNVAGVKFNVLGVDFDLYSTYEDALAGTNAWTWCNYNDPTVGFPRDCGPNGGVWYQWNSYAHRDGQAEANNHGYYVERPQAQG